MRIQKIGVIGAGTMGSGIAALAASVGIPVVLLDIPGPDDDRDAPARKGLERTLKAKPAAFMDAARANLIQVGNTEDDLALLSDCDWVLEAIIEQTESKRDLYQQVEPLLAPQAIVATNTSGIPMRALLEGRGEKFAQRFLGAHFFNPPRYLHLLELIPTDATDPAVLAATRDFGDRLLGKGIVVAKDTPGFIANRLGVHSSVAAIRLMVEHDLTIDEVDTLSGPLIGRPKSAVFRTADLTGLDVLQAVSAGLSEATGEDMRLPDWVGALVTEGRLGEKSGSGFYMREGKRILTLDWKTGEYAPQTAPDIPGVDEFIDKPLSDRLKAVLDLPGKYGNFVRALTAQVWHYALVTAPEIAYDLVSVDRAMEWGYGFERGPFRQMDSVGLDAVRNLLAQQGLEEPELLRVAGPSFYREGPPQGAIDFAGTPVPIESSPGAIQLFQIRAAAGGILEESQGAATLDIGEGVLLLEFRTKMGTLNEDVMRALGRALERVANEGRPGLVIGHDDPRAFSAGANLHEALAAAQEGEWAKYDGRVKAFQDTMMSLRRAPFPVVVAPFGLTLGGGAEMSLHADRIQAHAELYMGLVETGVGLLPAGGGTKELLFRFTEDLAAYEEANPFEALRRAFGLIAMARTSESALEARTMGFLAPGDRISMNRDRLIADARSRVLDLASDYVPPRRGPITALGNKALGNLRYGIWALREGGQITDHEVLMANEIAYVLCGGDGSPRQVVEQDILDLEREAFLKLLGTSKTQERITYTLETGKTLRN